MRGLDYVLKRVGFALTTIAITITLNFALFRMVPGDAVDSLRCLQCTAKFRAYLRDSLGLDEPLLVQFWYYVNDLLHGDLGTSLRTHLPVTSEIWTPIKNTVAMVALGVLVAIVGGVLIGVVAAWRRDTFVDRAGTWTALALNSLPSQWLGLMLVLFVAGAVGLPSSGITSVDQQLIQFIGQPSPWDMLVDRLRHMVLPVSTLAAVLMGNYTLVMRTAMLETLGEDYTLTARAKGLSRWAVIWRHALPNARLPLVTLVALSSGFVIGGQITIELVFSYPGIGLRMLEALYQRDWAVLQGIFLVIAITVILANLLADLVYYKLDPRVTT